MGLFLTLLYIFTAYVGPQTIFGPLGEYHIEIVIAVLALLASFFTPGESGIFRIPQSYALVGMALAVFLSTAVNGWFGNAPTTLLAFLPNAATFFLIVLNCRKKSHLQMVVVVLLAASLFSIFEGYTALRSGYLSSPYLLEQGNDSGEAFYRLRGLSFIGDPNDFSQLLISLLPCLFLFWAKGKSFRNVLLVYVPAALLVFGMYLTHSRGAIIAAVAIVIVATRRRIGTVPSLIAAAVMFAGLTATGWTGGREVSVGAGADRMDAWGVGMQLIRTHPLLGVGFGRFTEYNEITAHNTIVVCAAELGMFGLFSWVLFTWPTIRSALVTGQHVPTPEELQAEEDERMPVGGIRRPTPSTSVAVLEAPAAVAVQAARYSQAPSGMEDYAAPGSPEKLSEEELRRLGRIMTVALAGFLVAGWFLSRAYVMTLFIYGGMVQVIYRAALDQGFAPPQMPVSKLIRVSALASVGLVLLVYVILRVQHFLPH